MSFRIVGIGELLWDMLPSGRKLGGAPANFVYHAHALGADARVISRVGNDANGRDAVVHLKELGLPTESIEVDPALPTGTVTVELDHDGQPHYTIHENVAWDAITGEKRARDAIATADAVCFGTLAQRSPGSRETIRSLISSAPGAVLRVLDVNLRAPFIYRDVINDSLKFADVLKLNETELPHLSSGEARQAIEKLAARFRLKCVAFTRGAHGSWLFANGEWSDLASPPVAVVDTIGAGDSFTAALVLGLLAKWPLAEVHRRATEVAGFVCTQRGGTPEIPAFLKVPFLRTPANSTC